MDNNNNFLNSITFETPVLSSHCDNMFNMRYDKIIALFQDTGFLHLINLKLDMESLAENSNAIWVVTKYKFKIIDKKPRLNDHIVCETWPIESKFAKFSRNFQILNNNQPAVICSSDWCILDKNTMRIKSAKEIGFPLINYRTDTFESISFSRFNIEISDCIYTHSHIVNTADIDPNNHTNNVSYITMSIAALTFEEYNKSSEYEIHFKSQSHLGDEIKIYKKLTENGIYVTGCVNDTKCFECLFG